MRRAAPILMTTRLGVAAILVAFVACVAAASPAPSPGAHDDAAALLARPDVEHANAASTHATRAPRAVTQAAPVALPPPAAPRLLPRAWTLLARADAARTHVTRSRHLRAQAPRAPPPVRS